MLHTVLDFFIPAVCIHCSCALDRFDKIICPSCFAGLPRLDPGLIHALEQEIGLPFFDRLHIPYQFSSVLQSLIHLLKYRRFTYVAGLFGQDLAGRLPVAGYDLITAVPLHPLRQRERGYNQSALIAAEISRRTGVPFSTTVLHRTKNTVSQTKLNRAERRLNVDDSFRCSFRMDGLRIIIIDDVITTGSTLDACCRILKENGAVHILAAALATPVDFLEDERIG